MANQRNNKFPFGFLNNNQDPTDLKSPEATEVLGLDSDRLALGTLERSKYIEVGSGPKDWLGGDKTPVILNGRRFFLTAGVLEFEIEPGGDKFVVNKEVLPPTPNAVAVVLGETVVFSPNPATYTPANGNTITATMNIKAGFGYSGENGITVELSAIDNGGPMDVHFRFSTDAPGTDRSPQIDRLKNVPIDLGFGNIEYVISDDLLGESGFFTATFTITNETLPLVDGEYAYRLVNINDGTGDETVIPTQDIESLPGITSAVTIKNFDETGENIDNKVVSITFPTIPALASKTWLYRKGPDDLDFLKIAIFREVVAVPGTFEIATLDGGPVISGDTFLDDIATVTLLELSTLKSFDDESMTSLNDAIGNTSNLNDKIFEKDNRIWMQPQTRKDLLLYSRAGHWWGWQRANSFSFEGDVTDIISVRDPTTVGGTFTTVIMTTNGIYHITGDGSSTAPYQSVRAIRDIDVEANSAVDANGIIMLMSKAPVDASGTRYDSGSYGQKIYEYDLQALKEVSQRVKNSDVLTSDEDVEYAELRGSDKYLIKKENVDTLLLYHRDAQGWVETADLQETTGLWKWQSKDFTPDVLQRFKIAYARKLKIDYVGIIRVIFVVENAVNGETFTTTFSLPNNAVRAEYIQRLPNGLGRKWRMIVETSLEDSKVFDFYFVQ